MTIYNSAGVAYFEAPVTKDAVVKNVLMGDYYVELPFNSDCFQKFARGSYILYRGCKFEIMSNIRPEFDGKTGGYKYVLRFEAQQSHMKRRKVFWLKNKNVESCFHETTSLGDFGTLIADNMNEFLGGENWKVAAVPDDLATVAKLVSFNGDTCWNAINTIAQTFECEWWTVENGAEVWIYFGKLEFGTSERFERGHVVTSIPTKKGDDSNYGTRFYVFGSTRNLPGNYGTAEQGGATNHVSEVRLHLPDGIRYIDAWDNLEPADVVEQVAFFEDVYPQNTETVTSVETIKRKVENSGDSNKTFDAYVMYCKDTPFLPSDMIVGQTFGCKFTSGVLSGREFELAMIKDDEAHTVIDPTTWKPEDGFNKKFEIIADVEQIGENDVITIPNATLHPEPGDTFVLTGVLLPEERIAEAEAELLKLGKEWAVKNSSDTDVYDCPTNPVYCTRHDKNYELGQKVVLIDADRFGAEGRVSRIQGFEKKLWNEYEATYTVGDNTAYSRLGSIESSIEESAYAERIGVVSGVGIYLIRSKYDQTQPADYNAYSAAAVEAFFLSKIRGGTVQAPVYFKKNVIAEDSILSKDFKEGYFAGAGFRLGKDANGDSVLEVDNAIIRKKAVFNEVVINQISFTVGETIFSNGGCECTGVEELAESYRCYYDNKDGRRYSGLVVGDQVRCQHYDPTQRSIIKYYWRLVVAVGEDYVELSKTDCDGTDTPEVGDNLVQFGHRTDVSRQSAIVINPLNGGSVEAFAGIDSYTLSEKNRIGMGANPATGKSYLYGYGNLYFGDRDMTDPDSTWITFQQKEGTERPKLYIKGNIEMGPDSTGLQNVEEFKDLEDKVDNIQVGGRNLLLGSGVELRSSDYNFAVYYLSESIEDGREVTLTIWGELDDSVNQVVPYNSGGELSLVSGEDRTRLAQSIKDRGRGSVTFKWKRDVNLFHYTKASCFNTTKVGEYVFRQVKGDNRSDLWWKIQGHTTNGEYLSLKQENISGTGLHFINFTVPRNKGVDYFRFGLNGATIDSLVLFSGLTPGDYTLSFNIDNNIQGEIEFSHIQISPGYNNDKAWAASFVDQGIIIANDRLYLWAMSADGSANTLPKVIRRIKLEYDNVPTDWTLAPEDVSDEIGSQNLILKSHDLKPLQATDYSSYVLVSNVTDEDGFVESTATVHTATPSTVNANAWGNIGNKTKYAQFPEVKKFYVLSFDYKTNVDNARVEYTMQNDGGTNVISWNNSRMPNTQGEWKRGCVLIDTRTKLVAQDNTFIVTRFMGATPAGSYISLRKIRFSESHVVSSWAEAPDDLQFIKQIFPTGLINNTATISQLLAVRDSTAENANIVAGIYGGGVEALESSGFKDPTHGKLMIFAGASSINKVASAATRIYEDGTLITNKLIATDADITGKIVATRGQFGALKLDARGLYTESFSEASGGGDSGLIWPSLTYTTFINNGFIQVIGNTSPSEKFPITETHQSSVMIGEGGWGTEYGLCYGINISCIGVKYTKECIGIKVSASGASNANDALRIDKGDIYIEQGKIKGFRLDTVCVTYSQSLRKTDSIILVRATSAITLTLPSDPEDGQLYFIKSISASAINITLTVGATGHYINDGRANKKTSWTWPEGCFVIVVWDAVNKTWQGGYTNMN